MPSPDRADRGRQNPEDGREVAVPPDRGPGESRSDVFLDVPALHVDELNLEVDDLEAHVSLQAEVLDLLKLNVGADVRLGRVELDIEGWTSSAAQGAAPQHRRHRHPAAEHGGPQPADPRAVDPWRG